MAMRFNMPDASGLINRPGCKLPSDTIPGYGVDLYRMRVSPGQAKAIQVSSMKNTVYKNWTIVSILGHRRSGEGSADFFLVASVLATMKVFKNGSGLAGDGL